MLEVQCPNCGKVYTPELAKDQSFNQKFTEWQKGTLVQRVWPHAKPIEREQLQTGICSDDCWNKFLGVEE
jgi:hypothetical protein